MGLTGRHACHPNSAIIPISLALDRLFHGGGIRVNHGAAITRIKTPDMGEDHAMPGVGFDFIAQREHGAG